MVKTNLFIKDIFFLLFNVKRQKSCAFALQQIDAVTTIRRHINVVIVGKDLRYMFGFVMIIFDEFVQRTHVSPCVCHDNYNPKSTPLGNPHALPLCLFQHVL